MLGPVIEEESKVLKLKLSRSGPAVRDEAEVGARSDFFFSFFFGGGGGGLGFRVEGFGFVCASSVFYFRVKAFIVFVVFVFFSYGAPVFFVSVCVCCKFSGALEGFMCLPSSRVGSL